MKRTSIISREENSLISKPIVPENKEMIYVKDGTDIGSLSPICGKLEYIGQSGDTYSYREVAFGCIWIYLLDDKDCSTVDSGMQHQCSPGNTLNITGCHSFVCSC